MAGVVVALLGLYLLFGPIEHLARKPSPIKRKSRPQDVPTWLKVFFRGLGIVLLVLAALLLAPFGRGA
jgi:Na+/H+ antiporter NhaD/arsenite permease-like protein